MAKQSLSFANNFNDEQVNNAQTPKPSSQAIMRADIEKALRAKAQVSNEPIIANDTNVNQADSIETRKLDAPTLSRVIEMAWEDRTPFEAIEHSYGLDETGVIKLMRQALKPSSFRLWRRRVTGRHTKHHAKRGFDVGRAYCKTQYKLR